MPKKTFYGPIELKADGQEGEFRAVFATMGVIDLDEDYTESTAFEDGQEAIIEPYNHSWDLPAGKGIVRTDGQAAWIDGQFFLDTQAGQENYKTVKNLGDLAQWSYTFNILDSEIGQGARQVGAARILKSLDVIGVSPVTRGAGIDTRTAMIKGQKGSRLAAYLMDQIGDNENAIGRMADEAGISESTVRQILSGSIDCPPEERLRGFARALNVSAESIMAAARRDGCEYTESRGNTGQNYKTAIPFRATATTEEAWDGPANEARLKNDGGAAYFRRAYAWVDPDGDPDIKSSYKFIHHMVDSDGNIGAANIRACQTGIGVLNGGRGGTTIPDSDRQGVWNHLAGHLRDADLEPPELKSLDELESSNHEDQDANGAKSSIDDVLTIRQIKNILLRNGVKREKE